MKKLLCLLLAMVMVLGLAACGGAESATESSAPVSDAVSEAPEATEAEASEAEASVAAGDGVDLKTKWAALAGTTLTVATSGQQAGWSQDDENGGVEGMDIDVMNYICDYYGINLEWRVADPTGLWGMLQSGEVDTIACLTTTNADRLEAYWFSNTYAWESYSMVSRIEDGVPEAGDLSFWDGKTICTPAGSNPALLLEEIIAEQKENGVEITGMYPDSSAVLIQNVINKETDAALMTTSTCAYKIQQLGYSDVLNIQDIQKKNMPIVYAWNRVEENKDTILAINELLDQMHADGTLTEMSNKWFGMDVTGLPEGCVNYVEPTGENAWNSFEG